MLRLIGINKKYDEIIYDNLNLEINDGFIWLRGKSGCGKSTLLKIIAKDTKYQGKVLFNNKEIAKNDICYVASDQNAIMDATLFENFMALRKKSNIEKNKQMEYFYGLMALFNLPKELVHMEYKALSTGQRKRFIFVLSLFLNKKIYLYDELTENLDEENRIIIYKAIKTLAIDHFVIFVSHDEKIREYVNTILTLENKEIKKEELIINNGGISLDVKGENDKEIVKYKSRFKRPLNIIMYVMTLIYLIVIFNTLRNVVFIIESNNLPKEDCVLNCYSINDIDQNTKNNTNLYSGFYLSFNYKGITSSIGSTDSIVSYDFLFRKNKLIKGRYPQKEDEVMITDKLFEAIYTCSDFYEKLLEIYIKDYEDEQSYIKNSYEERKADCLEKIKYCKTIKCDNYSDIVISDSTKETKLKVVGVLKSNYNAIVLNEANYDYYEENLTKDKAVMTKKPLKNVKNLLDYMDEHVFTNGTTRKADFKTTIKHNFYYLESQDSSYLIGSLVDEYLIKNITINFIAFGIISIAYVVLLLFKAKLLRNEIVFYNWCGYSFKDKLKEYLLRLFIIPSFIFISIGIIYHLIYYYVNNNPKDHLYQKYAYGYSSNNIYIFLSLVIMLVIYNLGMLIILFKTKRNEGV